MSLNQCHHTKGVYLEVYSTTFEGTRQHITLMHGKSWGSYYKHDNMSGSTTTNSLRQLRIYC
jgi:hypothetical protein